MRALLVLLSACVLAGQNTTRLYIEPFEGGSGDALREEIVKLLKSRKQLEVVGTAAGADRILAGTNQTYIKGYISRNPRVRYRNGDSRPVYAGYVSVELKDRQDETVWSDLVTPGRLASEDVNKHLADEITTRLLQFLGTPQKNP